MATKTKTKDKRRSSASQALDIAFVALLLLALAGGRGMTALAVLLGLATGWVCGLVDNPTRRRLDALIARLVSMWQQRRTDEDRVRHTTEATTSAACLVGRHDQCRTAECQCTECHPAGASGVAA